MTSAALLIRSVRMSSSSAVVCIGRRRPVAIAFVSGSGRIVVSEGDTRALPSAYAMLVLSGFAIVSLVLADVGRYGTLVYPAPSARRNLACVWRWAHRAT